MPRQKRVDEAGGVYHALNRGNASQTIFHKEEDYEAFLSVVSQGLEKHPVELLSNCSRIALVLPHAKSLALGRSSSQRRYDGTYASMGNGNPHPTSPRPLPHSRRKVEMWCHPPLCRILRWTAMQGSRLGTAVEVPPSMLESLVALGIDLSMWSELVWNFKKYLGRVLVWVRHRA